MRTRFITLIETVTNSSVGKHVGDITLHVLGKLSIYQIHTIHTAHSESLVQDTTLRGKLNIYGTLQWEPKIHKPTYARYHLVSVCAAKLIFYSSFNQPTCLKWWNGPLTHKVVLRLDWYYSGNVISLSSRLQYSSITPEKKKAANLGNSILAVCSLAVLIVLIQVLKVRFLILPNWIYRFMKGAIFIECYIQYLHT